MARKLTPEELERNKTDFDPPVLPTLQNKKGKKAATEYTPPKPKKLPSEIEKELFAADEKPAKRGRGHQSPWKEGTELQRVNVFLPVQTARLVKAAAVMRGVDLGVLLDELIRDHISLSSP